MKDLISSILHILHHMGRFISLVRNIVFNSLFLLLILIAGISLFTSSAPQIEPNSILKLTLSGNIVEETRPSSPFDTLFDESLGVEPQPDHLLLREVLSAIDAAGRDPSITAILLDMKGFGYAGLNQMRAIGKELTLFKKKGKKVVVAQDLYTQQQYYLASYADEIILNPMGGVELHGFGIYPLYFKDALEKLKINYHVFRVGTYKSAIERITRNSMSKEARSQNSAWLTALWNRYSDDVTRQRGLTPNSLDDYIENIHLNLANAKGDTALLALESGLVDRLFTREEFREYLQSITGASSPNFVSLKDYLEYTKESRQPRPPENDGIAIIVAEGNILAGNQPPGLIGSESLSERLRKAKNDDAIKAVVLRINSGGGSAFASEIIRQELLEIKKTGKPVVVSMGAIAASGGYWIAANADQIWASPTTITGSIGIFGAIPTFENTLAALGVNSDGVGTSSLAAGMNLTQPLSPKLKQTIQLTVNNGYDRFLSIVQDGRNIQDEDLSKIGEGRVFSAQQAKELHLIDELGSLDDATKAAAKLAGIDSFTPVYIERESTVRDRLLASLASSSVMLFPDLLGSPQLRELLAFLHAQFSNITLFDDPHGIYAHVMLQLSPY